MKKKFLYHLLLISFITLILASIVSLALYYYVYVERFKLDLKNLTKATSIALDSSTEKQAYLKNLAKNIKDFRITLIDEKGMVIFDSVKEAALLPPHQDRPEFIKATEYGTASLERYSTTIAKDLYYVSQKLADGKILRLAREMDNTFGAFLKILPINIFLLLLVFFLASYISKKLTIKVFAPLNNLTEDFLELDLEKFPEILPFMKKIQRQNSLIKDNLTQIKKEKETIQAILKNMKEGLIIVDEKKNILSINKASLKIFDPHNNLCGKNILNLIRDEKILQLLDEALKGKNAETILSLEGKDYKSYINPFFENDVIKGVVILFIDETERLRALKLREEFSSNVSHELKTPLTSIYGFSEMLLNNMVKGADKEEFYRLIYQDAKRLLTLIDDIMKISGLEKRNSFLKEDVNLNTLIQKILISEKEAIDEKNITVNLEGSGILHENSTLIFELFANLISNAIKYNKNGGKITIKIIDSNEAYKIYISDTGIGISQKDLTRIFERFYRVDKSRSKKIDGTGLGLSIVKHIVKAIGGELNVTSTLGEGTTFSLFLQKNAT